MTGRGLVITIALAFIFFGNINWAAAEDGNETAQTGKSEGAQEKVYRIEEIVVTAKGAEKRSLPYSVDITGAKEIEASHARTLSEIVEGKPGISFETDGPMNSRIGIRGLARERVSLLLDGNRQLIPRNAGTDIAIDPWDVERIEIIKGANGLSYACDTIGGITNIILKRPLIPETGWGHGQSVMSGFSSVNDEFRGGARVWFSEAKGKYVQASGTYREAHTDIETGEDYSIPNTTYRNATGSLILGYEKEDSVLEGTYYGRFGSTIGTYKSNVMQDPDNRQLFAFKYKKERQGIFKSTEIKASYMRFDIDFRFFEDDLETTKKWFIGEWDNYALEVMTNLDVSDTHDLFTGINVFWTPVDRWQEDKNGNFVGGIFPDASRRALGVFLQDNISFGDRFAVSGVLRLDHNILKYKKRKAYGEFKRQAEALDRVRAREKNYFSPSGNLGMNYKLTEAMNLRWNAGTVAKPTQPGKFSVFVPAPKGNAKKPGKTGNPELDLERSVNTELGLNYLSARTELDVTAFYTKIYDYLTLYESKSLSKRVQVKGKPPGTYHKYVTATNQDATLYGAELGIEQEIIKDFLSFKGTISYAVGSFDDPIPDCVSQDTDLPLVPPLRGFVALEFTPFRNMSIMWKTRYAAKQSDNSDIAGEQPTGSYEVHDLYIDYTFDRLLGLRDINLYLNVLNLTDEAYAEHTAQYKGVALGFEEAHLQPGINVCTGISFEF